MQPQGPDNRAGRADDCTRNSATPRAGEAKKRQQDHNRDIAAPTVFVLAQHNQESEPQPEECPDNEPARGPQDRTQHG